MRRPGWTFNIKDKRRVYPDLTRMIEKEMTAWLHNNTSGYYDYNFPELYVFLENSEDAMIFKLKFGEYLESSN